MPAALASTGADVIALQEAYLPEDRAALLEALRGSHPFTAGDAPRRRALLGHGMLLLSRFPLRDVRFTPLEDPLWDERALIARGFLSARVEAGAMGLVSVTNAHLTAGGVFAHPEQARVERVRARQLDQAARVVRAQEADARLLVGDLNAGPEASRGNYDAILSRGFIDAQAASGGRQGEATVTWDPNATLNRGTRHGRECPPQRIDHILLSRGHGYTLADARVVLDEATVAAPRGPVTLSDHFGFAATLVRGEGP